MTAAVPAGGWFDRVAFFFKKITERFFRKYRRAIVLRKTVIVFSGAEIDREGGGDAGMRGRGMES